MAKGSRGGAAAKGGGRSKGQQPDAVLRKLQQLLSGGPEADGIIWSKSELFQLLFWVKFAAAVCTGVACGWRPVLGYAGFIAFGCTHFSSSFMTYRSILRVDEEEFGGHTALLMEDLNIALPIFLLSWIISYSLKWF